jgi:selenoprotein W-related protein
LTAKILPRLKRAIESYEMIPSKGGCFEVVVDGQLVYSKLDTGRFPDEAQIVDELARRAGV